MLKGLLRGRAVVRFLNTGDQIVIDCIFVFLFPFLTPQIPKGAGVGVVGVNTSPDPW